jgi:lipopolysaccharide transport system ATP-binding protein
MSSSDLAIRIQGLSKSYTISHGALKRTTFGDVLMERLKKPFQRAPRETFWALKDVSFDVKKGEVVGIIGRNGAGKSTLLKILSRITEPTTGNIKLYGRVGSLLEVGTGFHPELTGRENIYLNGAILGMTRPEIRKQFDAIVDFAEVEKFLDTPVKRYSSGMYVRLAFAVAAHLNPEILIVDEVLAVGDAQFQKKCLGKMGEVAKGGRTVLFVSHNMAAVISLCSAGILLQKGAISYQGSSQQAVAGYLSATHAQGKRSTEGVFDFCARKNPHADQPLIKRAYVFNSRTLTATDLQLGEEMCLAVEVDGLSNYRGADIGFFVRSEQEQHLAYFSTAMRPYQRPVGAARLETVVFRIKRFPFTSGRLWIDLYVAQEGIRYLDFVDHALDLNVHDFDVHGSGFHIKSEYGPVLIDGECLVLEGRDGPSGASAALYDGARRMFDA